MAGMTTLIPAICGKRRRRTHRGPWAAWNGPQRSDGPHASVGPQPSDVGRDDGSRDGGMTIYSGVRIQRWPVARNSARVEKR